MIIIIDRDVDTGSPALRKDLVFCDGSTLESDPHYFLYEKSEYAKQRHEQRIFANGIRVENPPSDVVLWDSGNVLAGYLTGLSRIPEQKRRFFVCVSCISDNVRYSNEPAPVPVYYCNLGNYSQRCITCKTWVIKNWASVLFDEGQKDAVEELRNEKR